MGDALHTHGAVTDAKEARLAQAGLLALQGATALDTRTGVMFGASSTALLTGTAATAPMTVQVAPHHWLASRGAANGPYLGMLEAVATINVPAAPGSGTRVHVVYSKQRDAQPGVPTPDGVTSPEYGLQPGVVDGVKPSIPVGAEEIGTVTIAAGTTSTLGAGATIANTARQTVARGAAIPVRNQAERDLLVAFNGLSVRRLDLGGLLEHRVSGRWVRDGAPTDAAYSTWSQAVGSGAASTVGLALSREVGGFSVVSNALVVPVTGLYDLSIAYSIGSAGVPTGRAFADIARNGASAYTPANRRRFSSYGEAAFASATSWELNAGDQLRVDVFHTHPTSPQTVVGELIATRRTSPQW